MKVVAKKPSVVLKRDRGDIFVDNYNPEVLEHFSSIMYNNYLHSQWCILPLECWCHDISTFWDLQKFEIVFSCSVQRFLRNISMFHVQCSISIVSRLFLRTAYMLLCVQTQKVQITLSCSNFNTVVHKGEIQCPHPPFTICSECTRMPCFRPSFRKSSSHLWPSCTVPAGTPHDISTPENKDTPLYIAISESELGAVLKQSRDDNMIKDHQNASEAKSLKSLAHK